MRVLLVEDDPLIGNGLQIGLSKSGFVVDWFTDGTDQIKLEIKNRVWNGLNVGPQDKIRVYGKLDNEMFEKPGA